MRGLLLAALFQRISSQTIASFNIYSKFSSRLDVGLGRNLKFSHTIEFIVDASPSVLDALQENYYYQFVYTSPKLNLVEYASPVFESTTPPSHEYSPKNPGPMKITLAIGKTPFTMLSEASIVSISSRIVEIFENSGLFLSLLH